MPNFRKPEFDVWLIASGKDGDDLEETLRMSSLGHFLHRIDNADAFFETVAELSEESITCPNLLLYLMPADRDEVSRFFERLSELPECRPAPVIVFHGSDVAPNVKSLYAEGASSVIRVPIRFEGLVDIMRTIEAYWSEVVSPPKPIH